MMFDLPKLWCYGKNGRKSYFLVAPISCNGCGKEITFGHEAYHLIDWKPKDSSIQFFCIHCVRKGTKPKGPLPPVWFMQERRVGIVIEDIAGLPPGAFPVQLQHHGLTDSRNITTAMAASQKNAPSERVIDNTKLAGRADSTFLDDAAPVVVGRLSDSEVLALDAMKNAPVDDIDQFLEDQRGEPYA